MTERTKIISYLNSLKPTLLGCHVAVPGQNPPSTWNVLFVIGSEDARASGKAKAGVTQLIFDDLANANPKIKGIVVLPAVKTDPQVQDIVAKAGTNPTGGCSKILPAFAGMVN